MAGRPRKPDHLKLVSGTAQPCRMNKKAPKPKQKRPTMPRHLSAKAKAGWKEAVAVAARMGVLTEADSLALEMMAEAISDVRTARASLAQPLMLGEEVFAAGGERYYWTSGKGGPMRRQRPEIADINEAERRFAMWATKFGLTPADRSRVSTIDQAEKGNAFAEFG